MIKREILKRKKICKKRKMLERKYQNIYIRDIIYKDGIKKSFDLYYNLALDFYDNKYWVSNNKFNVRVNKESKVSKTVDIMVLIQNIIMWNLLDNFTIDEFDEKIDEKFIIERSLKDYEIEDYVNHVLDLHEYSKTDMAKLNYNISNVIENLAFLSEDFSIYKSYTMNLWDFAKLYTNNDRFRDLYSKKIDYSKQSAEIERDNMDDTVEMINILTENDNSFLPLIKSGTGIKNKQACEFLINAGSRPDIEGNTFPYPIDGNFTRGINSIRDLYQDACGAMKASVMNKKNTGDAGYLSTKISLATISRMLSRDFNKICDTHYTVRIDVKSKKHLKKINMRYYHLEGDKENIMKINSSKDTHLIGQSVYIFSPMTCADDHICYRCYGDLAYVNNKKHVGIEAGLQNSEAITQLLLSAKHLLETISVLLEFISLFYKYFSINSNIIELKNKPKKHFKDVYLIINSNDIELCNEQDDIGLEFNTLISKFHIENPEGLFEIEELNESPLFAGKDIIDCISPRYLVKEESDSGDEELLYKIPLSKFVTPVGVPPKSLFTMEIVNNELTKPLNNYKKLLNKDHLGETTIDGIVNKMLDILIESKLPSMLIHSEIILSALIRDTDNILKRPDFSKDDVDYSILGIHKAIMASPSAEVSLCYEQLTQQLGNPLLYKKIDPSLLISKLNA